MDAKRLARAMLDDYGMKPNQRKFGKFDARLYLNKTLLGRARSGIEGLSFEESYAIETALMGIDHALGTGRVGGMITQHVAKLTFPERMYIVITKFDTHGPRKSSVR